MTTPDVGLANINVVRDFSYTIASSSLSYVRNYNFNTSTLTPIQVVLQNKSANIPITVDISASHPWLQIREPGTNKNLVTPNGNVVLTPTSSKLVNLNVDLPPEIEALGDTSLQISMSFYLRSGSYPIITETTSPGTPGSNIPQFSFDRENISVQPNNITDIEISIFQNGRRVFFELETVVEDETVAEIVPGSSIPTSTLLHTVSIRGIREGNTRLQLLVQPGQTGPTPSLVLQTPVALTETVPIFVYAQAPSGGGGDNNGGNNDRFQAE